MQDCKTTWRPALRRQAGRGELRKTERRDHGAVRMRWRMRIRCSKSQPQPNRLALKADAEKYDATYAKLRGIEQVKAQNETQQADVLPTHKGAPNRRANMAEMAQRKAGELRSAAWPNSAVATLPRVFSRESP